MGHRVGRVADRGGNRRHRRARRRGSRDGVAAGVALRVLPESSNSSTRISSARTTASPGKSSPDWRCWRWASTCCMFPIASIATLALLIGAFLAASGFSSVLLAFKLRPKAGLGMGAVRRRAVDRDRHHDRVGLAAEFDRLRRHSGGLLPHLRRHLADHARPRAAIGNPGPDPRSTARRRLARTRIAALAALRAANPCARSPSSVVLIVNACGSILDVEQRGAGRGDSARSKAGANSSVRTTVSPAAP